MLLPTSHKQRTLQTSKRAGKDFFYCSSHIQEDVTLKISNGGNLVIAIFLATDFFIKKPID